MTEHLSSTVLNALADGELSASELSVTKEHLDICPSCTSMALAQALLKTATAKAGDRYAASDEFKGRMKNLIAQESARAADLQRSGAGSPMLKPWLALSGWAAAAVLLVALGAGWMQRITTASLARQTALATEISDLHVGMLAASQPLQVLSSDRHTVKPWFQGKIPFAFNLPEQLPAGVTLLGANLSYLHGHPVAQLVYAIGQHRASVFVRAKNSGDNGELLPPRYAGFQVAGFTTENLSVVAISDVDRARLADLVKAIEEAQK
jgi:anti-sigma factor RsiW